MNQPNKGWLTVFQKRSFPERVRYAPSKGMSKQDMNKRTICCAGKGTTLPPVICRRQRDILSTLFLLVKTFCRFPVLRVIVSCLLSYIIFLRHIKCCISILHQKHKSWWHTAWVFVFIGKMVRFYIHVYLWEPQTCVILKYIDLQRKYDDNIAFVVLDTSLDNICHIISQAGQGKIYRFEFRFHSVIWQMWSRKHYILLPVSLGVIAI